MRKKKNTSGEDTLGADFFDKEPLHTENTPSTVKKDLFAKQEESYKPKLPATSRLEADKQHEFHGKDVTNTETKKDEFFNTKSPVAVTDKMSQHMARMEEIEAELVRTKGRYIENVDNVKPGLRFNTNDDYASIPKSSDYILKLNKVPFQADSNQIDLEGAPQIRADGVILENYAAFDTNTKIQEDDEINTDINDPRSEEFMTCMNSKCRYRDGCLRYLMHKQRPQNKTIFYPESCRTDGVYLPVDGSNYTGYTPIEILESNATPSF